MSLVDCFDPPAFLPDFNGIPGQANAWHRAVYGWFEDSISSQLPKLSANNKNKVQFYNPARLDPGAAIQQPITWNAFPKELLVKYGRERALREADLTRPLAKYKASLNQPIHKLVPYRPLNEYCEWHVRRDPNTQNILSVAFSSEPPEFWQALFGDTLKISDSVTVKFPGDRDRVLRLYHELVDPAVRMDDLIAPDEIPGPPGQPPLVLKGQYNIYNKWNTTHGIAHLCSPPNSLQAEIQLGAEATILRKRPDGNLVVRPGELICCSEYGGSDRNSDPTIGSSVNALTRLGAMITLPNPVGLYMDHIDLSGWSAPEGTDVSEYVRIVRGRPGMIERLVIEVPAVRGFTVSDLAIGGEPIRYGGQIAECITVKLVGSAAALGSTHNTPIPCIGRCCVDPTHASQLNRPQDLDSPIPPGEVAAFEDSSTLISATQTLSRPHYRRSMLRRTR